MATGARWVFPGHRNTHLGLLSCGVYRGKPREQHEGFDCCDQARADHLSVRAEGPEQQLHDREHNLTAPTSRCRRGAGVGELSVFRDSSKNPPP